MADVEEPEGMACTGPWDRGDNQLLQGTAFGVEFLICTESVLAETFINDRREGSFGRGCLLPGGRVANGSAWLRTYALFLATSHSYNSHHTFSSGGMIDGFCR